MKVKVSKYKRSLYEIELSSDMQAVIWDFYVTRSFASSASQKRPVGVFGIKQIPFDEMINVAGIAKDKCIILPCTTMPKTLTKLDLETHKTDSASKEKAEIAIYIDIPRLCCIQPFKVDEDLNVKRRASLADCLFTHIRGAFAHSNIYFFDNGNVMLEDKDNNGKITASILMPVHSLIDWIKLIDANKTVYPELHD